MYHLLQFAGCPVCVGAPGPVVVVVGGEVVVVGEPDAVGPATQYWYPIKRVEQSEPTDGFQAKKSAIVMLYWSRMFWQV
jgi:hypothetical protein